ncbi:thioesterase [Sporosarcina sp. ACRSM]|uniref:thioesterase family protein n=1 Tax=Sporosarcina sp. ACRSM TaxID=2918216 RepID=UPI001EF41F5A|nr:thioesterase [Sporosarcina sp. ACRSM]MCG7335819.1 thioesterase [Sporosarcina sp. ACRSM]
MVKRLKIGDSLTTSIKVTKEMFAQFEGEVVHPTYSTVSMVYHMEWVSRNLILPYLEDGEEGMGAAVTVKHIAPSGLDSTVEVIAVVCEVSEREVVTEVTLKNEYGVIGVGEVKQVILPKEVIQKKLKKQDASHA